MDRYDDDEIVMGGQTDEFGPRLFDEHDEDTRGLDNEIDTSLRTGFDLFDEFELSNDGEILGLLEGAEQEAILRTLAQVRDNRRPCPPMRVVDLDAPLVEADDLLGAAAASPEAFPLFTELLEAWRTAGRPRIVRVDTEESYEAFRDSGSPERLALLARLAQLEQQLAAHLSDPDAHRPVVAEELAEAEALAAADDAKQIPLRMPRHFDGLLEAWHQGPMAAGSMLLPRPDGGRWVATASEPRKRGELEAAKAAVEAGVPAAAIVGYLPALGATLAAADALKALASGADDKPGTLLRRPEARGTAPFMVRLEPQVSPAIFALGELCCRCRAGDAQACAEWNRLASTAPAPLREAMGEVLKALQPGQTSVGGAIGDFFEGLWRKIRGLFSDEAPARPATPPALPPAPVQKALPQRASA